MPIRNAPGHSIQNLMVASKAEPSDKKSHMPSVARTLAAAHLLFLPFNNKLPPNIEK
jgi:hypothetical protein